MSESENDSDFSDMESGLLPEVKKSPPPSWDIFREIPPSEDSGSAVKSKFYIRLEKLAKLLAYLLTFCIVYAASVVSKGTMLFIIKQIGPGKNMPFCKPRTANWGNETGEFEVDLDCSVYSGDASASLKESCEYEREIERIAWIWAVAFCFSVPQLCSFLRSLRKCLFKFNEAPSMGSFIFVAIMECCHTFGLSLLCFVVLPNIDSVRALLLTSSLAIAPSCLLLLSRLQQDENQKFKFSSSSFMMFGDIFAVAAQLSGAIFWPLMQLLTGQTDEEIPYLWALPTALVLTSFGWWETFTEEESWTSLGKWLYQVKAEMVLGKLVEREGRLHDGSLIEDRSYVTRNMIYVFVAPMKMLIFFLSMTWLPLYTGAISDVSHLTDYFKASFGNHSYTISSSTIEEIPGMGSFADGFKTLTLIHLWVEVPHATWLLLLQLATSYIAYGASKFASKVQIQMFSFAFPISLVLPTCLGLMVGACGARASDPCFATNSIPSRLFFHCPVGMGDYIHYIWSSDTWLCLIWVISYLWINVHIWFPKSPRLATSEQIFGSPWYDGLFIDQSLMMNRRRDGPKRVRVEELDDDDDLAKDFLVFPKDAPKKKGVKGSDTTTKIYACATMWHEAEEEMMEMLKSIFRVDSDYSKRRLAQKYFGVVDPDYYEWESHILFDDSHRDQMTPEGNQRVINDYVLLLCKMIDVAGSRHFGKPFKNKPCVKYPTPYGGRLVWTLPGKTKIVCHLKDKQKIRHKKRWSQIMYMYYLLGYKIMDLKISDERKEALAANTYLLALDGDVDFQPEAIIRLVDLMKKNKGVGAACGRIHPTGSGYMPAYQVFEYAVGHWLQKATEHVLGCVLCSPGCFSLFRGQAIMDDNVMRKYTTVPKHAQEHIQYDQGEDRWLCTLMLQQGWRVEYSAASDSYTACPEDFDVFYKQRKRWMPSTLLNILDLLGDWKEVTKKNEDISKIYILYQMGIMVGTFIGPGAIYLVLAGALQIVFGLNIIVSIILNGLPLFFFCVVCYYMDGKFQLALAKLLTLGYTMLMLAVYVGVVVEILKRGMLSASALSAYSFFMPLLIAGILHPEEAYCMLCMPIYLITIPSMYVLLVIYSLFNLNDISWGTRESAKTKAEMERDAKERQEMEEWQAKNKTTGIFQTISSGLKFGEGGSGAAPTETGSVDFSIGNVLRCMCFTKEDPKEEKLDRIGKAIDNLSSKLNHMEKGVTSSSSFRRRSSVGGRNRMGSLKEEDNESEKRGSILEEDEEEEDTEEERQEERPRRDERSSPYWIEEERLGKGPVNFLKESEIDFWDKMITKYLLPFDPSPVEQAKEKKELAEYRDSFIFTFVMINVLYIVGVIMLQFQANFKIDWILFEHFDVHGQDGLKYAFEYTHPENTGAPPELVILRTNVDKLDVIGLAFLIMFSSIVVAQMVGMIFHRWQTLCQYIASTRLQIFDESEINPNNELTKVANDIVRSMQAPETESASKGQKVAERRKTISALVTDQRKTGGGGEEINLEKNFRIRFENTDLNSNKVMRRLSTRRGTMAELNRRRQSYVDLAERRRSSVMLTSINTRGSSFSSNNGNGYYDNKGYEEDSVFEDDDNFTEFSGSTYNRHPTGRNSVQFDVSTTDMQISRV